MPALLSSLIKTPVGGLAGALAAGDDASRRCLRQWLALVPDHRSVMGRWHPLEFVLALAICALTAAGHDSPAAAADWAAGCSQRTLAVLGGRRDPWGQRIRAPSGRTFARVFTGLDAGAFNAAVYGYLRIRRDAGPTHDPWTHQEIAYGITSLPQDLAGPRHLVIYARNHWSIENREQLRAGQDIRRRPPARPHREPAQRLRGHPQPGHRRLPPRRVRLHRPRPHSTAAVHSAR